MSYWSDIVGTVRGYLVLGTGGVRLKNSSGALSVRNAADSADAQVVAASLKADAWYNSSGTENFKCRAWVNFNGTGTVAIRASGNVSSITDLGTADFRVNFTTAMPDANYTQVWSAGQGGGAGSYFTTTVFGAPTTSSCTVRTTNNGGGLEDPAFVTLAIFR